MVHIKRIELTNFKSFGGTTSIPVLPGFTVVSGPNGSGKSNILDALLFCLGLSTSKGMRAERLPDLVNSAQNKRGTIEASVTATFALEDVGDEWFAQDEDEDEDEVEKAADDLSVESVEAEDVEAVEIPETEDNNGQSSNPKSKIQNPKSDELSVEEVEEIEIATSQENNGQLLANNRKSKIQNPKSDEWSVTRKLRVTRQGTYTSNYYINGAPCTLTQLHEQLNRLRIYPEGYNVVLQGDVTSIISMNSKERREIIDELAGVAQFDRKISLARQKLDEVKEVEERSGIVEKELISQRDRLANDRAKAEKYQKLRAEFQEKSQWEIVLKFRQLQKQEWKLREQIETGDRNSTSLTEQLQAITTQIQAATAELDALNARVKALGESELLALQASIATQEAERRQLQNRKQDLETTAGQMAANIAQTEEEVRQFRQSLEQIEIEISYVMSQIGTFQEQRDAAQQSLDQSREVANAIASTAEVWVQQQTELHRQIETIQQTLEPQRTEQATIGERADRLQSQIQEQNQSLQVLEQEITAKKNQQSSLGETQKVAALQVESLNQIVVAAEQELQLQQETQTRLLEEQRERQRKLDKLEVQFQAQQEASGTFTAKIIAQSGIGGVCGLVAQLGRVEPRFQLALEIAAGGRMGNMVVENDSVGAAAIELLKQKRAGRMTFLPLNKIRGGRFSVNENLRRAAGFLDAAVNLIECDARYQEIFAYVFGSTVVFSNLTDARRYLGQYRIVTLDGEILETSGAMTGGSSTNRSTLHFGTVDASDAGDEARTIAALQERIEEIERILERCKIAIDRAAVAVKTRSQELMEAKQNLREHQLRLEQLESEIKNLQAQQEQVRSQIAKNTQELTDSRSRLQLLARELPAQETQLQQYRQTLAQLEESNSHSEWQQMQSGLRAQEAQLQERELALRNAQQRQGDLQNQFGRLEEKIKEGSEKLQEWQVQQNAGTDAVNRIVSQQLELDAQIAAAKAALAQIEEKLGLEKGERDRAESQLREQHLAKQQLQWQLQKLHETQQERREQLAAVRTLMETQRAEMPDPVPSIPENVEKANLTELQQEVKAIAKRIQALEPVNMLALEEYNRTQERLQELSQKLTTLAGERTELLLRIENFTTLRRRAFKEAFDAVNENFQTIFAELSEGDGYLQLDDQEDPFSSGLNLVAHPKGKPVQRLASMSGGEKSLTALSFIFALQRYRPSTFYAFDEVDMFLDGANVERLARMIKRQSEQAQFIVVSLRRPMIQSAERTIGVTQARGAYTQVIGLKL
ncbi:MULTISPECIES: chromosome segregation protein SMC [unclassified Microcoleus]|uniref:chromosome segregation protein SMC n=1 Tax=unclassified Microcoleus TaxID=2642155 RepID=UPI001D9B32A6|nr:MULTISPECIES: chromosome segregation protein SMC [unclassified Microcoleus]TAG02694.1 MAG: chromosome segregation protein SMC [Oscillatoriales cyanobacterium]MCC3415879.1 chromosome segregation protein SMC [Microcoleus sp. PH2017_02_FOX_O_A]MCC3438138.1 chromosome segregation protein SMC [Microcoleus sp. PH2017_05_CCC_O_A]TAG21192.1 MAG: chromosome segregation protein SMC [Oscillatoriales cyanobacterium]TAG34779.1 MAG: chromosome segregation protein SMC [Oscillatoriales cyanobacterium]